MGAGMRRAGLLACMLLAALLLASSLVLAEASPASLEGLDEPDVVGRPAAPKAGSGSAEEQRDHGGAAAGITPQRSLPAFDLKSRYVEVIAASCIGVYLVLFFLGMFTNKRMSEAWARTYALSGGLIDRNFSQLGQGGLLIRDSANLFKLYASGRRHCQGLLAELNLMPRQDLLSMLWALVSPKEDLLKLEVFMHEASMPPIVLIVATPKAARALQRDARDVKNLTKRISGVKDMPAFKGEKLWVLAEHSGVVQDLLADSKLQQALSFNGPNADGMKYFRSMHFTSENGEGMHKQVLRFTFKLPPTDKMDVIAGLMDLVPLMIDTVGTYRMPPDLKKRAMEARAKQENNDEEVERKKRQEALMQKKMEKAEAERVKLARMAPEARERAEEKMKKHQMKKQLGKKAVKIG